jgi:hypothetical protein
LEKNMPSDDILRLYTYVANTTIASAQVNAELNQLVSTMNTKFGRDIANTLTGSNTFTGANNFSGDTTFSSGGDPIKTDKISERTVGAGVTVDSVLLKDGMATVSGTPTTAGQIGYASNLLTYHNGSTVKTVATTDTPLTPTKYLSGPLPRYNSASSIVVLAGLKVKDSTGVYDIEVGSDITVSLASSGAAGLDTGSEASNTWYYVYLVMKTDGTVSAVLSTVNESVTGSITFPSGYTIKRQIPTAIRNDNSSNIIPYYQTGNLVVWKVDFLGNNVVNPTQVLTNGTSGSYGSAISCASFMPPFSTRGRFYIHTDDSGNVTHTMQPNGDSTQEVAVSTANASDGGYVECDTDSSQQIQYKTGSLGTYIDVAGWYVTGPLAMTA